MNDDTSFNPDWISPPGETVATIMEERRLTPADLARRMNRQTSDIEDLIHGRAAITDQFAQQLADKLGATKAFWTTRESQYQRGLARLLQTAASPESATWLSDIPVTEIAKWGWIEAAANRVANVAACLRFFGVSTVKAWRDAYSEGMLAVAFKTSPTFKSAPGAVAAWLRQGEIEASKIACDTWDPERFRQELLAIRELTREKDPDVLIPELIRLCASCGVAVVVLRAPKKCRASGVSRFLTPRRPLLMLSFRYLSDDHFWFAFFHEAGHLLLHSESSIFLEGEERLSTAEEEEANMFAANTLIPLEYQDELMNLPANGIAVMRFAKRVGVSPGIVVGQLQHRGILRRNQLNNLKRRYAWTED
jgi:plasmid maintenance system antidote protein VapI/Zn-dependent peptidase ImmA (M78 family)